MKKIISTFFIFFQLTKSVELVALKKKIISYAMKNNMEKVRELSNKLKMCRVK